MAIRPFCGKVTVILAFLCLGFSDRFVFVFLSPLCLWWGGGGGGGKLIASIPDLCFTSTFLTHQCSISENIQIKTATEMKQR